MRVSKNALDLALASKQMTIDDLIIASRCSSATVCKAKRGENVLPRTVGKIANALEIPVENLIEQEVKQHG